jgi:hypothetical protein
MRGSSGSDPHAWTCIFFLFKGADNFFFLIKKGKKTCNSFVADNVSFVSLESSHHNNGWKIKHMSVFTQKNSFLTHFNPKTPYKYSHNINKPTHQPINKKKRSKSQNQHK